MTYAEIMAVIHADDIRYDPWGVAMSWRFAIADRLLFDHGVLVEGFRPSPMGPETDDWSYEQLADAECGDLVRAEAVLARYCRLLERAGRSY